MLAVDGWIVIWLTLEDWDVPGDTRKAVRELEHAVEEIGLFREDSVDFAARNGDDVLRVNLQQEGNFDGLEACRKLLGEVSRVAPASFGILSVRDTDNLTQPMQRFVMRRGRFELEEDDIFSPSPPTPGAS